MPSCTRHPFERSAGNCSRCQDSICRECRVEARRRVFCLDCALAAAGVRTSGRSGRSAVQYRRRLNDIYAEHTVPQAIDLRDQVVPAEERTPPPAPARAPEAAPRHATPGPPSPVSVDERPRAVQVEERQAAPRADVRRRLGRRAEPEPLPDGPDVEAEETAAWLAAATEIEVTRAPSPRRSGDRPLSG